MLFTAYLHYPQVVFSEVNYRQGWEVTTEVHEHIVLEVTVMAQFCKEQLYNNNIHFLF